MLNAASFSTASKTLWARKSEVLGGWLESVGIKLEEHKMIEVQLYYSCITNTSLVGTGHGAWRPGGLDW